MGNTMYMGNNMHMCITSPFRESTVQAQISKLDPSQDQVKQFKPKSDPSQAQVKLPTWVGIV